MTDLDRAHRSAEELSVRDRVVLWFGDGGFYGQWARRVTILQRQPDGSWKVWREMWTFIRDDRNPQQHTSARAEKILAERGLTRAASDIEGGAVEEE